MKQGKEEEKMKRISEGNEVFEPPYLSAASGPEQRSIRPIDTARNKNDGSVPHG